MTKYVIQKNQLFTSVQASTFKVDINAKMVCT